MAAILAAVVVGLPRLKRGYYCTVLESATIEQCRTLCLPGYSQRHKFQRRVGVRDSQCFTGAGLISHLQKKM